MVAFLVLFTVLTFLTIDWALERRAQRAVAFAGGGSIPVPAPRPIDPQRLEGVPAGLFLGPGHVWVGVDDAGTVRVGADALPVTLLGGVDDVQLLKDGTVVRAGDPVAVLRRGERTVRLRAPIDGTVAAVNPDLTRDPARVAEDPYDGGWLYRLRPARLGSALGVLRVADDARAWMGREVARLRDVLARLSARSAPQLATTLADGGLPAAGLAASLDRGAWEEVTHAFFDVPGQGSAT